MTAIDYIGTAFIVWSLIWIIGTIVIARMHK